LADNGARVTLMDKNAKSPDAEVRRLAGCGADLRGQVVDETHRQAPRASVDAVAGYYGKLDVVFANAGIDSPPGLFRHDRRTHR
jgi:NAD(P)-dependent dehydrogenase (short-subunit alcohol dehydrogenase family)